MHPVLSDRSDFFIGCDVSPCVFEMYWRLRGMENALLDMAADPELATEMLSRCADFAIELGEAACDRFPLDWFWTGDDVAGQTSMMMAPCLWRNLVKPPLKRVIEARQSARTAGRLPLLRRAAAHHSRPDRNWLERAQPDSVQLPRHGPAGAEARIRCADGIHGRRRYPGPAAARYGGRGAARHGPSDRGHDSATAEATSSPPRTPFPRNS